MSPEIVGAIGVVMLIILLFSRMWVGATMMLVGVLGTIYLAGWSDAISLTGVIAYGQTANYAMASLPMFILMGTILAVTGIGGDLYYAGSKWFGHVRGGLAMATVMACGFFAAVCGESTATAITMGKVAYPEMLKYRYDERLAAASIAAGGTIGIMIPPSVSFILYGLLTEQSISKLFIAGVLPGVTQVLFYMVTIYIICRFNPILGPASPRVPMKEKIVSLKRIWPILLVFFSIVVGLYGGIVTPTEAGAIGAAASFIIALGLKKLSKETFAFAVKDGIKTTALTFFIIIGAYFLMRFMALSHLPEAMGTSIVDFQQAYHIPRIAIIGVIVLFYLIVGAFLDILAAILLTLPIIYPVVMSLGYDPIWWGVINVRVIEISMITPPFGLNLFVLSKSIKTSLPTLYKGVTPFIIADVVHIILLLALPELALYLPSKM